MIIKYKQFKQININQEIHIYYIDLIYHHILIIYYSNFIISCIYYLTKSITSSTP